MFSNDMIWPSFIHFLSNISKICSYIIKEKISYSVNLSVCIFSVKYEKEKWYWLRKRKYILTKWWKTIKNQGQKIKYLDDMEIYTKDFFFKYINAHILYIKL